MAPAKEKKKSSSKKSKNIDVLSSQYSQRQHSAQKRVFTPIRRTIAPNSLVKSNQSIFSPIKRNNENIEIDEDAQEYESGSDSSDENSVDDDSNDDKIDVSDDDKSSKPNDDTNSNKMKSLAKYAVPLNTQSWQPLLPQVHSELSILLKLLKPSTLKNGSKYDKALDSEIINPLINKFKHVYLPPINKITSKLQKQRTSGEFNLTILNQEQNRLSIGYDINSKQLDMLTLQLLKEKEMINAERKYLRELKENVKSWKSTKDKKLSRLRSNLGDEYLKISELLDSTSNTDGADDINLVNSEEDNDSDDDIEDTEFSSKLNDLNEFLAELETDNIDNKQFQSVLRQLLDQLKDE